MVMRRFLCFACLTPFLAFAQAPSNPPAPQPGSAPRGQQPQAVTLSTPIVTLGAPAVKRGDAVTISLPSVADVTGAAVTLGGRQVDVELTGKALLVKVPADQKLGPSSVLVTLPGYAYRAKDTLNVLAAASPPAIDTIRVAPATPQNGRIAVDIFGHGFSTQAETLGDDIQLLLDHSPRKVTWVDKDALPKQCDDERQKKYQTDALVPLFGSVIGESQLRVCNIPAQAGILPIGVDQGGAVPSKIDSVVITDWNPPAIRAIAGAVAIVLVVLVYVLLSFTGSHIRKGRSNRLKAMFVDKQTNTYSLSIVQFHMWTAATLFGYTYFALSRLFVQRGGAIPDVPGTVPGIVGIGIGAGTAIASQLIQAVNPKGAGEEEPSPSDLVATGGAIAPDRVQMLVWTFVAVGMFIAAVLQQEPSTIQGLPEIPSTLMQLMGLSAVGYLGGKFARKPGPNILELSIIPSTASTADEVLKAAPIDVAAPRAAAAERVTALKKMAESLSQTAAPAAVLQATTALTALESAVAAAAGVGNSAGAVKLKPLADTAYNAAITAAAEFERMGAAPGSETARVSANLAQLAANTADELNKAVTEAAAAAEANAQDSAARKAAAFRRVIELRGSNLSAEGIFRAKVKPKNQPPGSDTGTDYDLPFRMLEEKNGKREPIIVVPEEASGNAKFSRTLRLEIVPSKLDAADKEVYNAIFGRAREDQEVVLTIFNPDGQKSMKTFSLPPGEGQRD